MIKIKDPVFISMNIACLVLAIIGHITGNRNNAVFAVVFTGLLVTNLKSENKNAILYVRITILIIFLILSLIVAWLGY